MSLFDTDKTELMLFVLERYQCRYKPNRMGWQKVRCLDKGAHYHGDRNPSASVNLGIGRYHCFSCGLEGDGYELLRHLEGLNVKQVNDMSAVTPAPPEIDESDVWV